MLYRPEFGGHLYSYSLLTASEAQKAKKRNIPHLMLSISPFYAQSPISKHGACRMFGTFQDFFLTFPKSELSMEVGE